MIIPIKGTVYLHPRNLLYSALFTAYPSFTLT